MKKRGQFYIIAAIIIIGIIASLAAIYNTARTTKEDTTVYDLSEEINFEGSQILDSAVTNGVEPQIQSRLEELMNYYNNSNKNIDFLFIYGTESDLTFYFYNNTGIGIVEVEFGGFPVDLSMAQSIPRIDDQVTINTGTESIIDLKPGKFFFVVLKKEKEGERFVALSTPE
jgi:hypothetical protein